MNNYMNTIFNVIYSGLVKLSVLIGFSYKETNIIIYYYAVPVIFAVLIDYKIGTHLFKASALIVLIVAFLFINDFTSFSNSLFDASVKFLQSFKIIGWDYTVASIVVCVVAPIVLAIIIIIV